MARHLQLRKPKRTHTMPNKVTIRVELTDARPQRPAKSLGLMLMELRARFGNGSAAHQKFHSSTHPEDLREVSPPPDKRVKG
ncbi:MAG TPA: hypothetical protein VI454_07380 [Verrucomicrobiae bacterium]